jgi:propionate CoA-transferase
MRRNKVVAAEEAARLVLDGDTIATGGFVGIGFPEHLAISLEERFLATGTPRDLTLIFAAGQGDGAERGLNHFGHAGMLTTAIGGHWGLVPGLGRLALSGEIQGYCLPQGMISHWFRDIAGGRLGTLTQIGLGTFVDPRMEGGRLNAATTEDILKVVELEGQEALFLPSRRIDVALLRGTTADTEGNVTMEREALTLETLSIAQAVKNSGGIVIVQVERTTTERILSPREVKIPGILVDAVVVSPPGDHPQTFAEAYNPAYTGEVKVAASTIESTPLSPRKVIARRAAMFLKPNSVVNLGIGTPEGVASVASEEGILDLITLTVEAGGIGGIPAGGLSFGAAVNTQAIIDQPYQFDFYDGGGLDQAFLGMAEADASGNVNVSRFGSRMPGAGGFINISQTAKECFFLGEFQAGATMEIADGELRVLRPGAIAKFVDEVEQVAFNGQRAMQRGQTVYYITERCVLRLGAGGLEVTEIAPGLDLERQVLSLMSFRPAVSPDLKPMAPEIFLPAPMGLREVAATPLRDRLIYRDEDNVLFCNFEGLTLATPEEASALAAQLDAKFRAIRHRVHVIVNYDNFEVLPTAEAEFLAMVKHNERYSLSRTRYSTNAFFRRQLGQLFTAASLQHSLYGSFADAYSALTHGSVEP